MPELIVPESANGQRIDTFLATQIELSRSQIQKLIKEGVVTLSGSSVRPNARVETSSVIFYPETEIETATKTGPAPILNVLFEDDDVMVIDKPAGLIVHQASPKDVEPNVVDALLELHPNIIEVGDNPIRPGIVHRLDKDVSGVMVIAKTQEAFEHLKKQFQDRTVEKEYIGLVYGPLSEDHAFINLKIARSKSRGRMVARPVSQEGKDSITEYSIIERLKTTTHIRVNIHTGRTHQIRVHMHALGHPLVGDKLYKLKKMKYRTIELDRIFLHARRLVFTLLSGERKLIEVDLPPELHNTLRHVR
jgi:23S rRNA pseudouridine1911/1915/1917 synthase